MELDFGIAGYKAPELNVPQWIGQNGEPLEQRILLSDFYGKFIVLFCFQNWCPGCHHTGLPTLQRLIESQKGNHQMAFLAIQTVFEGKDINTYDRLVETQKKYSLAIPFGHDVGDVTTENISNTMYYYRTGGTPWFIFIDKGGYVVFNGYHIDTEKAIDFLSQI